MEHPVVQGHRRRGWRPLVVLSCVSFLSLLTACDSNTPSTLNPVGPKAGNIAGLSWLMFGIAAVVFVVVTILLLLAVVRSRRNDSVSTNQPSEDRRAVTLVLIGGAVIPAVVLLAVMILAVRMDQVYAGTGDAPLTVEVIGHRWWWEVRYPDTNVATANEVHIPINQSVTIRLTSADVIHSLWIPQLDGKFDMIPGQTNTFSVEADRTGMFRGLCAEYCGLQHAHMQFIVVAEDAEQFDKWLTNQANPGPDPDANTEPMIFEGQQAFLGSSCVYCHTIKGTNASGTLGPDLTHLASRATLGAGAIPNTPGNLAGWIINSQAIKPGNLMPPMDLDSDQLQSILAYLQTLQ